MSFHEVLFPVQIALGAVGGPERRTEVVTSASGHEERNQQWANSRRVWNVGTGVETVDHAETLLSFFEDRRGRLYGFLFLDPFDMRSSSLRQQPSATDQTIGFGDGATTVFQLQKQYGTIDPYFRKIKKPKADTVSIAVNGTPLAGDAFSVDATTGLVTLDSAPANGAGVTAGFKFYTPARFDTDRLDLQWDNQHLVSVPQIPVLEVFV